MTRENWLQLCLGVSQTGKSTFAFKLALDTRKQLVVWDANEVFSDVVEEPVYTPTDLEDALIKKEPIIVYNALSCEDRHEEFERVATVLENFDGHTLLVDEAGDVQRANNPNSGLDRLYRRAGRRDNVLIETTHRAADIATLNRTLTQDTYIFAMPNNKARKAISEEFSKEAAELAANLPNYVYIHFHNRTGQFEVVDDPESWYVDLSRPIERKRTPAVRTGKKSIWETEEIYGG